uniref:Uncharacterized protein n=1 Tax=Arundo donax TaxID=35708 RepID=A0A0A8YYI1_ARUDO
MEIIGSYLLLICRTKFLLF